MPAMDNGAFMDDFALSHGHLQPHYDPADNEIFARMSNATPQPEGDEVDYIVVYRVTCTQMEVTGEDHSEHEPTQDYLDHPHLFAGDSRGSSLRGRRRVDDILHYWEKHPEHSFVVIREYTCPGYHHEIRHLFEAITAGVERTIDRRLRPFLYQLRADGPIATEVSENIQISSTLSTELDLLVQKSQPWLGFWDTESNLTAPYFYFYHFRQPLRDRLAQLHTDERDELVDVLDYIDTTHSHVFDHIDQLFASGKVQRGTLRMLFAPNDRIVTIQDGYPRAMIAETVKVTGTKAKPQILLSCWTWTFDGSFRRTRETISVPWTTSSEKEMSIRDLTAWPLRLDQAGMQERLISRGRHFWDCRHRKLVCYDSPVPTIYELQITNPKYMIDYKTYRQMHPAKFSQALATEAEMREAGVNMNDNEPPDDLFCMLLPPTMLGYAFHDKKWRTLSIEHVKPVPWNKEAFNRLVLSSKKKETIKALVTVHLKTVQNVDVVENKGNGLIILLHGSPGTGKTLTAESVAEIAEKPLYRVTCGDVGTNAESVERYMESVLLIGTIWECVVLLDEADVFLEERQVTDLARNALVSVFLRILEYYDGILILTTNRVGTFDEAFKSRIQLAVHYPALDEEGRFEIWLNFINVLKEKNVDIDFEQLKRKAMVLARTPFNGRQIRNNLWTAAQVAKYKNERLDYSHLEQVVEISREFEEYLEKTRGHTDEENAKAQGVRSH